MEKHCAASSFPTCKMSKGHAELKGVLKCTVLRVGRIVPIARECSHVIIVRHIFLRITMSSKTILSDMYQAQLPNARF